MSTILHDMMMMITTILSTWSVVKVNANGEYNADADYDSGDHNDMTMMILSTWCVVKLNASPRAAHPPRSLLTSLKL